MTKKMKMPVGFKASPKGAAMVDKAMGKMAAGVGAASAVTKKKAPPTKHVKRSKAK